MPWAILTLWLSCACATGEPFVAAFWNVENLFDTRDDAEAKDEEFTPSAPLAWTEEVYHRKLHQIATGIGIVNPPRFPDLLGLAEIEHRAVLTDLIEREFAHQPIAIVHEESRDERGIDVALLYRTDRLREIEHRALAVDPGKNGSRTRDILYVHLKSLEQPHAHLHVLVNHWPARPSNASKRAAAARTCRAQVERILAQDADADILILGDLNDEPGDTSVANALGAQPASASPASAPLVNLASDAKQAGQGTITFEHRLLLFDQVIVSRALLSAPGFALCAPGFRIVDDAALRVTPKGPPRRFVFRGAVDASGFSDHFPVRVTFALMHAN